jgi:hypothetical protein
MPLSLGLRMGLSAGSSLFGWVPTVENSSAAVAFDGANFALPAYGPDLCSATDTTIVTTVAGKLYELSATGSGTITIAVGTAASGTNILAAATYATARYFTAVGTTTHLTVTVTTGSLTDILVREVMLGELGTNLGASGYTLKSPAVGTETMTESPTGTLNIAGDGTNSGWADKSFSCVIGRHYRIVCLVATNVCAIRVGTSQGGTQNFGDAIPPVGVVTLEFTATAATHWIRFLRSGVGTTVISSITIAEWTPRPTLRTATFSEVFAFTASSTTARTYVGSDGLIKNDLSADVPRVDYSNGRARYLFENQSTNLFQRSEEFDNAYWSKGNATVTSNVGAAPTGGTTADSVVPNTVSATHAVFRNETVTSGIPYTVSVYVKASGYNFVALGIHNGATSAGNEVIRVFDLSNGVAASSYNTDPTTSTIQSVGNGWYRIAITWTLTTTSLNMSLFPLPTDQNPRTVWVGDNASGCLAWGAQLEAQAFASSYIPTTTATVTRLIETPRFSPLVEAIFQLPGNTVRVQSTLNQLLAGQRIIGTNGASGTGILFRGGIGVPAQLVGGSVASALDGGSPVLPGPFGAVLSNNSAGRAISGNGGAVASDTAAVDTRAQVFLARSSTVANDYGNGYYNSFALYPFRATNANVQAIAVAPP